MLKEESFSTYSEKKMEIKFQALILLHIMLTQKNEIK